MTIMTFINEISYLLGYTEWDRAQWESWFRANEREALAVGLGANTSARITNIGELIRHIFAAEQRFIERIQSLPLSDGSDVQFDDIDALFAFGRRTRRALRQLLHHLSDERLAAPLQMQIAGSTWLILPKTMVVQAVTHEIRHWAQVAAFLRMAGYKPGVHDFVVSGVFGDGVSTGATPNEGR
jgi:uncharacterized damage-inducible protein DinB